MPAVRPLNAQVRPREGRNGEMSDTSPSALSEFKDRLDALVDAPPEEVAEDMRLRKKIEEGLARFCEGGKVADWRGHYKSGELFHGPGWGGAPEEHLKRMVHESLLLGHMTPEHRRKFVEALESGAPLEEPIPLPRSLREYACPVCTQPLKLGFDGTGITVLNDPCPYPDGLVTEWELNVPSGKIVVANDLRDWFPSDEDHDVNSMLGTHLTTLGYAEVGMSHGFVGNTCPDVYRDGEDRFVVGSYRDEIWDAEDREYRPNPEPCPWGKKVADVCTDLWWYSIVDYDEFLRRLAHYTPDEDLQEILDRWSMRVVDVRPGVYKFRHDQGTDRDAAVVEYATFERVRDADAPRDYLKEEREKSYTAAEVLIQQCLSWPSLYMGQSALEDIPLAKAAELWESYDDEGRAHALARAADQIMCVLGSGTEWHENGFPRMVVSDKARELAAEMGDVPPFDFEAHWYPISAGYGGLCLGAGVRDEYTENNPLVRLAPSFVLLGLNICQNAIRFGEKPRLNRDVYPPAYEVPYARERLRRFVDCYLGLRRRYPDLVFDRDFDRWMTDTDLDKYVAEFDFGPEQPPEDKWGERPTTVKTGAFFEFDGMKLDHGNFAWHPKKMRAAARKADAQRYHLDVVGDSVSEIGHLHMNFDGGLDKTVPLRVVGRVLRGTGDGFRSSHLEVAFDYGTDEMRTHRWALREDEMEAVRQFDDEREYAELLERFKVEFAEAEAQFEDA